MWYQAAINLISQHIDVTDSVSSLSVAELQTKTLIELQAAVMRSWRFHQWCTSDAGSTTSDPRQRPLPLTPRKTIIANLSSRLLGVGGGAVRGAGRRGSRGRTRNMDMPRFVGPNHLLVLSPQAIYLWNVHRINQTWLDVLKVGGFPDRSQEFAQMDVEMVSKSYARMAAWNHTDSE